MRLTLSNEERLARRHARQAIWRARNRDYLKQANSEYYKRKLAANPAFYVEERERNPERTLLKYARYRAKKRGIECSITEADIVIPAICPVLNIPLSASRGQRSANSPSLDRVDNSRGYVPGNVKVISWAANKLKNDLPLETIYRLWRYVNSAISPKGTS